MTVRNITYVECDSVNVIVSVDSAAGYGPKESDVTSAELASVIYYVARTAYAELVCLGLVPARLAIGLTYPISQVLNDINSAVKRLSTEVGVDLEWVGSGENYHGLSFTGVTVTCISIDRDGNVDDALAMPGDVCYQIGRYEPDAIYAHAASLAEILNLSRNDAIRSIVPVGSGGTLQKVRKLAENSRTIFRTCEGANPAARGGPGCVFLVIVKPGNSGVIERDASLIGIFEDLGRPRR